MQTQPDVFLHLTATGWTAIGAIVGAASIIALVVFNVLNLKSAWAALRVGNAQAEVAQKTLAELQYQFNMQLIAQKEMALAVLNEVARNARSWRESLHTERSINDKASLFPSNWSHVMVFIGQQVPSVLTEMIAVEKDIAETERQLNEVVHVPISSRASLLTAHKIQPLRASLEKAADDVEGIAVILRQWNMKPK